MDNNDLEITKELDNLNDITNNSVIDLPYEEIDDSYEERKAEQDVLEVNDTINSIEETISSIEKLADEVKDVKEKKKLKDKIKDKWNSFSKKKKIIIIVITTLVMLLIVLGVIFAVKHFTKEDKTEKLADVIFEADNYRYENGYLILLGEKNKELGKYECKNKDEELCYVAYYEIDEKIDDSKKINEDGDILNIRSDIIFDKYVFIHDDKNVSSESVILYDIKEKENIDEYNAVKSIKNQYAIVKDTSGSYGLLELSEETTNLKIDFNYDNLAMLSDESKIFLIANENGRNFLINVDEKVITKAIPLEIVNYNNKFLVATDDDGKYYLYDYTNKMVYEDSFDYIKLIDGYIAVVKDSKIYVITDTEEKLHEVGYDVNNKYPYYQKLYIYDNDNKLIDTHEAFAIIDNGNSITISVEDNDYVINKLEGQISATISYVNYFDGILYFYDNEDKTNLIGQYKCTNKNNLTDTSTTFDNCFVASDKGSSDNDMTSSTSNGIIPILNHRYVLIKDNPNAVSDSNTNVILYDLNQKKTISKYISVNTNLNTNDNNPSLRTESNVYIIARNKSNKYGVILINQDNAVSSIIPFNYSLIENIGSNYLVSDNNGYSLFDKTGKELTKKVSNKIRGYNNKYLKVYENNGYQLYDYEAKKLTNNGFKYIELYDNYFAGVDSSNKLNMYSYENPNTSLIKDSIQLSSNKYYGDGQIAFKISIAGTTANVSILNGESYSSSVYSLVPITTTTSTNNTTTNNDLNEENETGVEE